MKSRWMGTIAMWRNKKKGQLLYFYYIHTLLFLNRFPDELGLHLSRNSETESVLTFTCLHITALLLKVRRACVYT
jgi:hypothetical protein